MRSCVYVSIVLVTEAKELNLFHVGMWRNLICVGCTCSGSESEIALKKVVDEYEEATGYRPIVFEGSSHGACTFGHILIKRK